MTCEMARRQLALYLYQELTPAAEEQLETHLDGCQGCRDELACEKALHQALCDGEAAVSMELLAGCRAGLREQLHQQEAASWGARTWRALMAPAAGLRMKPAAALAFVVIGFAVARLWNTVEVQAPELRLRNLQASDDGTLRVVVEEVRRKTLSGAADDDRMRELLLRAASGSDDAELRARTIDVLKANTGLPEVRQTLLSALQQDPSPRVRVKAIEGLRPFAADPDAMRALTRALLGDDDLTVRTVAMDVLLDQEDAEAIGALQELVMREQNPYIRQRSVQALRARNASVGPF